MLLFKTLTSICNETLFSWKGYEPTIGNNGSLVITCYQLTVCLSHMTVIGQSYPLVVFHAGFPMQSTPMEVTLWSLGFRAGAARG